MTTLKKEYRAYCPYCGWRGTRLALTPGDAIKKPCPECGDLLPGGAAIEVQHRRRRK